MILKTKKIEIIVPKEKANVLLEEIQNLEIAEMISSGEIKKERSEVSSTKDFDSKIADLNFARMFLVEFEKSSGFLGGFLSFKPKYKLEELKDLSEKDEIKKVVKKCAEFEAEINNLKSKKDKLESKINILQQFEKLTLTSPKENLSSFGSKCGILKGDKREDFLGKLKKEGFPFFLEWGRRDKEVNLGFGLVYPQNKEDKIKGIFKEFDISEQDIFWEKEPEKEISEKKRQLIAIEDKIREKEKKTKKLTKFIPEIKALIDFYGWERSKQKSFLSAEKTKTCFSVLSWVPENSVSFLEKKIEEITPSFLIREREIKENEKPPIVIKNKKAAQPFESVTNVYGAPKHSDPDPTPFLAPFFALFFALALSDAGYGLVLFVGGILAKRFFKDINLKKFFNLLIISGFLTVIAGVLTGTVFGTELAASYRILDSVKNPVKTMIVTLVLGAFQIFVGLIIGMIWDIKHKGWKKGISGRGANVVFFLGLALFILAGEIRFLFGAIIAMVALKIVFSQEKKVFLKVAKGIGSLYDLVGYFGDIISYSRILALGLATGIIAMVVNVVAFLFKDMIPIEILGWVVAILVLVGGHTFNILINSLGAFIHSARLQFVEFFPKFMEGGGRYLKPLSKQGRFIKIIK